MHNSASIGATGISPTCDRSGPRLCIAVLDRCGNNWKNGKGGCGPLLHDNYCPTLPTMFHPFVVTDVRHQTTGKKI